jgi:hypothetical protein|eukprot:SAG25_NODE_433_length_8083_cov_78.209362_4_plen_149_part_00
MCSVPKPADAELVALPPPGAHGGWGQGAGGVHPPRPGDWVCAACSNTNFAFRTVCNKCAQPKPPVPEAVAAAAAAEVGAAQPASVFDGKQAVAEMKAAAEASAGQAQSGDDVQPSAGSATVEAAAASSGAAGGPNDELVATGTPLGGV